MVGETKEMSLWVYLHWTALRAVCQECVATLRSEKQVVTALQRVATHVSKRLKWGCGEAAGKSFGSNPLPEPSPTS